MCCLGNRLCDVKYVGLCNWLKPQVVLLQASAHFWINIATVHVAWFCSSTVAKVCHGDCGQRDQLGHVSDLTSSGTLLPGFTFFTQMYTLGLYPPHTHTHIHIHTHHTHTTHITHTTHTTHTLHTCTTQYAQSCMCNSVATTRLQHVLPRSYDYQLSPCPRLLRHSKVHLQRKTLM